MKILIIGSKGFIGKHTLDYFRQQNTIEAWGCDVIFDTNDAYYFCISPDSSDFNEIFRQYDFNVCINCSGAASVPDSIQHPWRDYQLNTINVFKQLEAIRQFRPNCKYINLSSAAVYGNPIEKPITENTQINPISPYGSHKVQAELICKEFYTYFNIQTCMLRIFSAYGEGLKKQLFWDLYQKTKTNKEIVLFGTGKESRDFIYVHDLVTVIDLVIQNANFMGEAINVANGYEVTIQETATVFYNNFNEKINFSFSDEVRKGDPNNWLADISTLKSYGYQPKFNLEQGLNNVYKWIQKIENE